MSRTCVAIPGRSFLIKCKRLQPSESHWGGRVYVDQGVDPPDDSYDHEFWFPDPKGTEEDTSEATIEGFCTSAMTSHPFSFQEWLDEGATASDLLDRETNNFHRITFQLNGISFKNSFGISSGPGAFLLFDFLM